MIRTKQQRRRLRSGPRIVSGTVVIGFSGDEGFMLRGESAANVAATEKRVRTRGRKKHDTDETAAPQE